MNFTLGVPDHQFVQRTPRRGLITKMEVRVVSLAKLALRPGDIVWDIGTGSGSVAIEAARLVGPEGRVYAIEKNAEDVGIARQNLERFGTRNVTLVHGRAPEGLSGWPDPDAVFLGGTAGAMADLVRMAVGRLRPGGRLVANTVTLENLHEAATALRECGWEPEMVLMQVSRAQPILHLTRFVALDPVYVVSSVKPEPAGRSPT